MMVLRYYRYHKYEKNFLLLFCAFRLSNRSVARNHLSYQLLEAEKGGESGLLGVGLAPSLFKKSNCSEILDCLSQENGISALDEKCFVGLLFSAGRRRIAGT
jgi:hypothetical protein